MADLFIRGLPHSITARYFSSNPSDSGSLRTPCPPASKPAGRRGITPAFGYSAPHPSAGGTLTLLIHALPSTHCKPLRHPTAPGLSLTGVRLTIPGHVVEPPVLRTLSLCTCCRHYPGAASERITSLISSRRISLPRKGCRVGLRIVLFEDCSAFTRVTACTLALSPIRDTLIEGFSHFVTSMTAPITSGWSGCRVGLPPTGKRRLVTAHTHVGHRLTMFRRAIRRREQSFA